MTRKQFSVKDLRESIERHGGTAEKPGVTIIDDPDGEIPEIWTIEQWRELREVIRKSRRDFLAQKRAARKLWSGTKWDQG